MREGGRGRVSLKFSLVLLPFLFPLRQQCQILSCSRLDSWLMRRECQSGKILITLSPFLPPSLPPSLPPYLLGKILRAHSRLKIGHERRIVSSQGRAHDLLDFAGVQVDAGTKDHFGSGTGGRQEVFEAMEEGRQEDSRASCFRELGWRKRECAERRKTTGEVTVLDATWVQWMQCGRGKWNCDAVGRGWSERGGSHPHLPR